jgi:hypothetical protein
MLRKTKNEISFDLFTMPETPDKIAEVQKTDDRVAEGTLRTTSSQNISESFFGLGQLAESVNAAEKVSKAMENDRRSGKEHLAELSETQKSRHLSGFDPKTSNGSSIISANAGGITDMGGPQKQIKLPSSNSIFDPWKNQREAERIGEKTEGQIDKERVATNRRTAEKERMDELVASLQSTNQTKASSIHRTATGESESTAFRDSRNNMSIFDSSDFARIPEKTEGEKISEKVAEKRAEVDSSWRGNGKSLKSSEMQSNFFDSLLEKLNTDEC